MAARIIRCAKLGRDLPAIDPDTPKGNQALKVALLIGGREMQTRVLDTVSAEAWEMWTDHMRMVMNEFRLDPMSDEANRILRHYMQEFFFGGEAAIPNYVPPAPGQALPTPKQ
jgi:Fe-S cluster biosynthesis and repair protein YggX